MSQQRTSAFGLASDKEPDEGVLGDLSMFTPGTRRQNMIIPAKEIAETVAQQNNFPSREPKGDVASAVLKRGRRYTTGRKEQMNLKTTAEYRKKFEDMADRLQVPLVVVFEMCVDALEEKCDQEGAAE